MFFRLAIAILLVTCAEPTFEARQDDAAAIGIAEEPSLTSDPNNDSNTAVSISLNNLPKGLTTETSIDISVSSNDGGKVVSLCRYRGYKHRRWHSGVQGGHV